MATAYHQPVDAFNATPDGQQIFVPTAKYNSYRERQYAPRMNPSRSSSYNDYPIEKQGFDNNIGMSPDTQQQQQLQQQQQNAQSGMYDNAISVMPSPYESSQQHQQQQLQSQPQSQSRRRRRLRRATGADALTDDNDGELWEGSITV